MLDEEAYAFLRKLGRRDQRLLEREFDSLRKHPFTEPSFVAIDDGGEEVFYRVVANHVIAYHVDHAVRCVFIQQIYRNS